MPFASALSEHPVSALATGEVAGAVLEGVGERPDLVMVVTTRSHAGALEDIARTVQAVLHPLVLVGCSSGSVVGTGRQVRGSPAIGLWAGRVGPVAPVRIAATRRADRSWHFAGWPDHPSFDAGVLILMADPFTFPTAPFVDWLGRVRPGLAVVGGSPSGGRGAGGSRLVAGTDVVTAGAVGVLVGGGVHVEPVVAQGCRGFGDRLTVTRSEGAVIHEIAGRPARECLADQISAGRLTAAERGSLGRDGVLVGRLLDDRIEDPGPADYLVRSVVGADRSTGALAVEDPVPAGTTVRFHLRDALSTRRELAALLEGRDADAAWMFAGTDRHVAPEDRHHDAGIVARSLGPVPVAGILSAGELGPLGGSNFAYASAASLVLFRERAWPELSAGERSGIDPAPTGR